MSYNPTYDIVNRQRKRQRARPEAPSQSSFITVRKGGSVYSLTYSVVAYPNPSYRTYKEPYPHPFGYVFPPTIKPPYKLVGPVALDPTQPAPAVVSPAPVSLPAGLPPDTKPSLSVDLPSTEADSDTFVPGTIPSKITVGKFPVRSVLILAKAANTGTIWVGFRDSISAGHAFPLVAGAANNFTIDDLNKVYFLGENATDAIYYEWFN